MAKKHKHEEHQNLEAWVISYADMVTLLFALFVVLYAIGETKLAKLKKLKKSLQFAFSFSGNGKTQEPGVHDKGQDGRGKVIQATKLINAQSEGMKKYLEETLPENFTEVTGKSLRIVQTDDTIAFVAPLSAYFDRGAPGPLKEGELRNVVDEIVSRTSMLAASVRVHIDSPNVVLHRNPVNGLYVRSGYLCHQRLEFLLQFLANVRNVDPEQIQTEFKYLNGPVHPPDSPATEGWEDRATLTLAFSNTKT